MRQVLDRGKRILLLPHLAYFINGEAERGMNQTNATRAVVSSMLRAHSIACMSNGLREKLRQIHVTHTPYTISEQIVFESGNKVILKFLFPMADGIPIFPRQRARARRHELAVTRDEGVEGLRVSHPRERMAGARGDRMTTMPF